MKIHFVGGPKAGKTEDWPENYGAVRALQRPAFRPPPWDEPLDRTVDFELTETLYVKIGEMARRDETIHYFAPSDQRERFVRRLNRDFDCGKCIVTNR